MCDGFHDVQCQNTIKWPSAPIFIMLVNLLLQIISANQNYWANDFTYPIRTEDNSQKINFVMLAEDLQSVKCSRQTAGWVRTMWHDFATYNQNDGSGGVDGSIIFELDRLENTRLDTPTYYLANKASEYGVSLADTIALAAIIAIRSCGGPKIPFYYGRDDAFGGDPTGRLLFTNATFSMMVNNLVNMNGLSFPQFVAAIGILNLLLI